LQTVPPAKISLAFKVVPVVNPFINTSSDIHVASTQQPLEAALDASPISRTQTNVVIGSVTCITALSAMLAGVITVAIPTIAADINLAQGLLLW